ncbi:MAG TPA: hypothetical protein VFV64_00430 [Permianibacter sp.]|nr:hypothetical protein [Permianibacter sp.]
MLEIATEYSRDEYLSAVYARMPHYVQRSFGYRPNRAVLLLFKLMVWGLSLWKKGSGPIPLSLHFDASGLTVRNRAGRQRSLPWTAFTAYDHIAGNLFLLSDAVDVLIIEARTPPDQLGLLHGLLRQHLGEPRICSTV